MRRALPWLTLLLALIAIVAVVTAIVRDDEGSADKTTRRSAPATPGGPPPHARGGRGRGKRAGNRTPPAEPPRTPQARAVARHVERELGRRVGSGERTVIAARCQGPSCTVRYRSAPRGEGAVLSGQSRLLRSLFADARLRTVLFYVHHQTVGRNKDERPAFVRTLCVRSEHPGFDWTQISPSQIRRRCEFSHVAGGKQRSGIKRGELSPEEAARGRDR